MEKMNVLTFDGELLRLEEAPLPVPGEGEALIRVLKTGICNTDLEITRGYMDYHGVLGHEFVGVVEKAENPIFLGKRIVGEINMGCGGCEFCLEGDSRHCPNRTVLGIVGERGAFGEYLVMPEANLHVVPQNVSDLQAVFTEPLAAACEILTQLDFLPHYRVLVLGDGKLAQLIARVLALQTENLLVVGKHAEKLKLLSAFNIKTALANEFAEPPASYHVVVEATGNWNGWEMALKYVRPKGYLVLKSTYAGQQPFNPAPIIINEINVIGSRCGPFTDALHLLYRRKVVVDDLVSGVYHFRDWEKAWKAAQQPDSLKIVLDWGMDDQKAD